MTIKTKFNIGAKLYYNNSRFAKSFTVATIRIESKNGGLYVIYCTDCSSDGRIHDYTEEHVYPTKEACNLAIIEEIAGETK